MTPEGVLRWWPPVGILAMVALGLAVGDGSTRIDDWFIDAGDVHRGFRGLLFSPNPCCSKRCWSLPSSWRCGIGAGALRSSWC